MSKKLVRCGDKAPDDTYKMLECRACGGEFPHTGRGRPPVMCPWAREQENIALADKRAAAKRPNSTGVPTFEEVTEYRVGDLVYRLYDKFGSDIIRRRYAFEYKVTKVEDDAVTVIRTAKRGYPQKPVLVPAGQPLYKKTGVEYIDIDEDDTGEDLNDDE